jgi:ribosomal protein S18 acetylase RimI-like enzyme
MRVRKMAIEDLVFVNQKFYLGKSININTLKSNFIYVAKEKTEILGILFADATKTGTAILFAIEVLEEYRKNGIALKLMNKFENDAVKKGINTVITFYNNIDGIEKFYEKFNYEIGTNLNTACKMLI